MDIGSLGSLRLEQVLQDPRSLGLTRRAAQQTGPEPSSGDFSAYLEKAKKAAEKEAQAPEPSIESETTAYKSIKTRPVIDKGDKLYELCESLETFLLKTLITGMRNTVQKSGLIDNGFAGKMYEDMLYDEYAKTFSKNANFGLAELAYLELTNQRGKLMARNI